MVKCNPLRSVGPAVQLCSRKAAGGRGGHKGKRSSGKGRGHQGNPRDGKGNIMKCHDCGSEAHLLRDCPHQKGKDNSEPPGEMAELGEKVKGTRYGTTVPPLSFESYGRMGPSSRATLKLLAGDAATSQPRASTKSADMFYREWRLRLERTLLLELPILPFVALAGGHRETMASR